MFLKGLLDSRRTLAFRLTLWYAGVFTLSSFAVFYLFYLKVDSFIHDYAREELVNDFKEYTNILKSKGLDELKSDILIEAESEGENRMFVRLLSASGEELAVSDMSAWEEVEVDRIAFEKIKQGGNHVLKSVSVPSHQHEIFILYGMVGPDIVMQLGRSMRDDEKFLEQFRETFASNMGVIIVLAACIGWIMAKRALAGMQEVTQAAIEISGGDLNRRVSAKSRGTEIDRLANTFNSMLDHIQSLVTGMREMTDNIAHDLRSPITRIRGIAEMALTGSRSVEAYENMAADTIEECDRLLDMINTMLDISEAETGTANLNMEPVDIAIVAREAAELFEPLAKEKKIDLISRTHGHCPVSGDKQKLQRLIANLIDNAIKYTDAGGTVSVDVRCDEKDTVITVSDTGIGIEPGDIPHIFDRFYRGDKSRSEPGVGLGLSLARAIARVHGGDITVSSPFGKGSTFTVTLPALSSHHRPAR